jgi:hypothetical protein
MTSRRLLCPTFAFALLVSCALSPLAAVELDLRLQYAESGESPAEPPKDFRMVRWSTTDGERTVLETAWRGDGVVAFETDCGTNFYTVETDDRVGFFNVRSISCEKGLTALTGVEVSLYRAATLVGQVRSRPADALSELPVGNAVVRSCAGEGGSGQQARGVYFFAPHRKASPAPDRSRCGCPRAASRCVSAGPSTADPPWSSISNPEPGTIWALSSERSEAPPPPTPRTAREGVSEPRIVPDTRGSVGWVTWSGRTGEAVSKHRIVPEG